MISCKAVSSFLLASLVSVGCASRVLLDESDGVFGGTAGDETDDVTPMTFTGGPTDPADPTHPTDPTGPTDPDSTTTGPTDPTSPTDPTDPTDPGGCGPDDECQADADCAPGQTCLASCTCFGDSDPTDTGETVCSDAASCEECAACAFGPGGDCEAEAQACFTNPDCTALLLCQLGCEDPLCGVQCFTDHPNGQQEFFAIAQCMFSACSGPC